MSEFKNPEKPFKLPINPGGEKIRERLEKEYDRRISIFKNVLVVLEIPEDLVVLAPPVLDRTDFGYTSDIDLVFLGTEEQRDELYQKLYASFEILSSIIHIDQERLAKIESELPELYQFLMQRRGNIPIKETKMEIPVVNFWDEALELEIKARTALLPEDKLLLKEQRLKIGRDFVDEVKQRIPVLGHNFSGSMMTDMERFGTNSDLDIGLLTNPADEKAERNAFDWIHLYLKWKYAERFGTQVDASDTSLNFARMMASHDSKFKDYYQREFGIDITKEVEN